MLRFRIPRYVLSLVMALLLAFSCIGNASASEYDLYNMTDDELLELHDSLTAERDKISATLASIAQEIEDRTKRSIIESLDSEFPEGYTDATLQLYEGVYQAYSVDAKMFGDKSYFIVKDGFMYQYEFPYGNIGSARMIEYDLIPYEGTNTIYTDRQDYVDYRTGKHSYISANGVKFNTNEDGQLVLKLYDWNMLYDSWSLSSGYDTYYKVNDVTQEELDNRYYKLVGRPDPSIGMTADQVRNSTWGAPKEINKSTYSWGTKEQWVYSNYRYIYLENGVVTSIHE